MAAWQWRRRQIDGTQIQSEQAAGRSSPGDMSLRDDVINAQRDGHQLQRYNVLATVAMHVAHPLLARLPACPTVTVGDVLRGELVNPVAASAAAAAAAAALDEVSKCRIGAETVDELPDARVATLLEQWGVSFGGAQPEDARRALVRVVGVDFWRLNYELHPRRRRVRNWIWVHNRYRAQATELCHRCLALAKPAVSVGAASVGVISAPNRNSAPLSAESAAELRRLFVSFTRKIDTHHRFEERVLFPWLLREQEERSVAKDGAGPGHNPRPRAVVLSEIKKQGTCCRSIAPFAEQLAAASEQRLESQHVEITGRLREEVVTSLDDLIAACHAEEREQEDGSRSSEQRARALQRATTRLEEYNAHLLEHLVEEERELLHIWLLKSQKAYVRYRNTLPFFYQVMY